MVGHTAGDGGVIFKIDMASGSMLALDNDIDAACVFAVEHGVMCFDKRTHQIKEINQAEINLARNVWIKEVQTMILNDAKYMKGLMVSLGAYIDTDGFIRLKRQIREI